jgi:quercetin dioxygenase-like cupin family protein
MTRRRRAAETTGGSDEREARFLSVPLLRVELGEEAARLRSEQEYVDGDRNARTLAKVGAFRLVIVAFRSGARFDERDQRGSIAFQVLEGRIAVQVDEETVEVGEAEIAVVAPQRPWKALALAVGVLLIHLAWPPEPGSAPR